MQVVYLMSGAAHAPYLLVSLHSLRKHWDGLVTIHAWPESYDICRQVCSDTRLQVSLVAREPVYRGKNDQFTDKIRLLSESQLGDTVYLDADTMICGSIGPLFSMISGFGFTATQFCDWTSSSSKIQGRISRLYNVEEIPREVITLALQDKYPSVNGGIVGANPSSQILPIWLEWTVAANTKGIFISDETVLHTLVPKYKKTGQLGVLCGGTYNCSPKFVPKDLNDSDIMIWHFHGDSNVRPQKSLHGVKLWYPQYQHCLQHNYGNIQDWRGLCGNKYLTALEQDREQLIRLGI